MSAENPKWSGGHRPPLQLSGRGSPDLGTGCPLKPETRVGLLLCFPCVRVRLASNLVLRFRRLPGVGSFISSATAEDHRAAGEENQTHVFHASINNKRSSDFQQRYWFSETGRSLGYTETASLLAQ